MKTTLLLLLTFYFSAIDAQNPVISGDTMLCPWTDGTASVVTNQVYDSYTWYTKYWFDEEPFVAVDGVSGPTFTYDWYTYDQSLIKVVVTLNGITYESNTIQIDSYAWSGMTVMNETGENVTYDPDSETFFLCEGTTFDFEVMNPYSANIQWFRNDVPIQNANSMTYTVAAAGTYYVTASPGVCPDNESTSLPFNVAIDTNCDLSTENPIAGTAITLSPNPANDFFVLTSGHDSIEKIDIYNISGQLVYSQMGSSTIERVNVPQLAGGLYIVKAESNDSSQIMKFLKL
ncbi:MAG TPA: T9SS type A sorting domain-containing protein [Flavobacterium sp.]|jgi:hypothetical protein